MLGTGETKGGSCEASRDTGVSGSQAWYQTPLIPALVKQGQVDLVGPISYRMRPYLKQIKIGHFFDGGKWMNMNLESGLNWMS